mmetsp:Transcript_300/g.921  ORF Transcript_300/g.921 Transcript_300/m.921 type:complete len:206 (-) Transcript_300:1912-2529(-)
MGLAPAQLGFNGRRACHGASDSCGAHHMMTQALAFFCLSSASSADKPSSSLCRAALRSTSSRASACARSVASLLSCTSLSSNAFCSFRAAISSAVKEFDRLDCSANSFFTMSSSSWSLAPSARTSLTCSASLVAMVALASASARESFTFWSSTSIACCSVERAFKASTSFCSSDLSFRSDSRSLSASCRALRMCSALFPSTAVAI